MTATPNITYAQSTYAQARGFSYADDASFARIAATFTSRTAIKTAAVAIAVIQTAFFAVLSAATYPVSFISPEGHERFTARMNATAGVIADVAKSAVWGDPKTQTNPNAPKSLVATRIERLKTGAAALLTAAKQKASNTASGASALASQAKQKASNAASQAKQKVSSAATGTTTFVSAHKKEILIASVVIVATTAAVVAAYHFDVIGQVRQAESPATSSKVTASATEVQSPVKLMGPAISPLANATIIAPQPAVAAPQPAVAAPQSAVAAPQSAVAAPEQEGYSTAAIVAGGTLAAIMGTGAVIGSTGGPVGAAVGAVTAPVFVAISYLWDAS